ncbi:DMT family transporter [Pigmentibacter sp. JX0631]|uniref:DMT family transporter n=1 Tax=Pigmentibacter sp. JX0631 TaxID=2976982 RepID=UPI0024688AAD|nr:DMT family transporter [Pigmentibacter sp. JX0631]WGL58506.1 DMT family transporter [Pigmentibacter sp. JX0631]
MFQSERFRAEIALVLLTIIWGLTFPVTRIVVAEMDSFALVFFRSLLASLVLLPFVFLKKEDRKACLKFLPLGAILGFLVYLSYLFQSFGLETITSARSAFLTNLTIIFVPLMSPIFQRQYPNFKDYISMTFAFVGMILLTSPFDGSGIGTGDIWTILCAVTFSMHIHTLQKIVKKNGKGKIFAFLEIMIMCIFAATFIPINYHKNMHILPSSMEAFAALFYLGAISMVGTTLLQANYQCKTTPERASLIYILEPLFAILFGYMLLKESMTTKALFGGFLIIFAVIWVYFLQIGKKLIKNN